MKTILCLLMLPLFSIGQDYIRKDGESAEDFVNRIAPSESHTVKFLLTDKFNTESEKIAYAYTIFEAGNIVNNADSTLTFYACILVPDSINVLHYSEQKFKMVASYKKRARIESAEVVKTGKGKCLQVYVSELVRGPGGVPRDVKRTYVYGQQNYNRQFTEQFKQVVTD